MEDGIDGLGLLFRDIEVFSPGWHSIVDSYRSNWSFRVFLDTIGGKSRIDALTEFVVVKGGQWVVSLVLLVEGILLFEGEVDVEHRQDTLELSLGDLALAQLVKIEEEFFDSNSFHHYQSLQSLLDIRRIVRGLNPLLEESVVNNIQASCWILEVCRTRVSELALEVGLLLLWILWFVLRENVFWPVDIVTELEVVDFSDVSFVEVLSEEQLEHFLIWRDQFQFFENSPELLRSDVAALGSVVVFELGLDENSFVLDLRPNRAQEVKNDFLLLGSEICSGLGLFN